MDNFKIPLLLALGTHGKQSCPHEKFFEHVVKSFFKHHFESGKQVIVIFEGSVNNLSSELGTQAKKEIIASPTSHVPYLNTAVNEARSAYVNFLNRTINAGVEPAADDMVYIKSLDWGNYVSLAIDMNRKKPNSIVFLPESVSAECILAKWNFDIKLEEFQNSGNFSGDNQLWGNSQTALWDFTLLRDALLLEQLNLYSQSMPEAAFAITRGSWHAGLFFQIDMAKFDTQLYLKPDSMGCVSSVFYLAQQLQTPSDQNILSTALYLDALLWMLNSSYADSRLRKSLKFILPKVALEKLDMYMENRRFNSLLSSRDDDFITKYSQAHKLVEDNLLRFNLYNGAY